jgi:ABC-2 type transport system permease protein
MMTAPVSETDLVIGKFLGSFGFFLVLLVPTLFYVVLLRIYGRPDYGPIASGYLGLVLVGGLFVAIGLFCSSLTRSQVVAAVASAGILFVVTIVPYYASGEAALPTFWRRVTDQGVMARYTDFSKGVVDTGNLVYFLATTGVFLFLTVKVMEARRWK